MRYLLEIQIPSIEERAQSYRRLITKIKHQIEDLGLEDVVNAWGYVTPRGKPFIGDKRFIMYKESEAAYTVQIDDDDDINDDYVRSVCEALDATGRTCFSMGYHLDCNIDSTYSRAVIHGAIDDWYYPGSKKKYTGPFEKIAEYIQTPYPKVPIRTDICKWASAVLMGKSFGEDYAFAMELRKFPGWTDPKNHSFIPRVMYKYNTVGKHKDWYEGK